MLRGKGTRFYDGPIGLTSSPTATDRGEGKQHKVAPKNGRWGCVCRRGAVVCISDEQRDQGSSGVFRCGVDEKMVEGITALRHALERMREDESQFSGGESRRKQRLLWRPPLASFLLSLTVKHEGAGVFG
ncbi:unnamed protein product [Lactuca saligna]|uniref:Uncharacterized protein n=1 Tax=Lactuca saligna TaxID=75948 RepID=A0AA36EJ49_LACSI|nr:unnamed protein product [Lactuca saligna]